MKQRRSAVVQSSAVQQGGGSCEGRAVEKSMQRAENRISHSGGPGLLMLKKVKPLRENGGEREEWKAGCWTGFWCGWSSAS